MQFSQICDYLGEKFEKVTYMVKFCSGHECLLQMFRHVNELKRMHSLRYTFTIKMSA